MPKSYDGSTRVVSLVINTVYKSFLIISPKGEIQAENAAK